MRRAAGKAGKNGELDLRAPEGREAEPAAACPLARAWAETEAARREEGRRARERARRARRRKAKAGPAGKGAAEAARPMPRFPLVRRARVQALFRQRDGARREALVPMVRLSGAWLEAAGFATGRRLRIEAAPGRLTIEAAPA